MADDSPTDRLLGGRIPIILDHDALKEQAIVLLGLDHARKAAAARQMAVALNRPMLVDPFGERRRGAFGGNPEGLSSRCQVEQGATLY